MVRLEAFEKIARLHELAAAGLPVPEGLAVLDLQDDAWKSDPRIDAWLANGPLIVRGAFAGEDGRHRAGAGLGVSVPDCRSRDDVTRALTQIASSTADPWLRHYDAQPEAARATAALIQRQIDPAAICVVACPPEDEAPPEIEHAYVEVHRTGPTGADPFEALAQGRSPEFAGPVATWDDAFARPVRKLIARARETWGTHRTEYGLDLEIVVDRDARAWLVQLRPLTASPWPGWSAFQDEIDRERAAGQVVDLSGLLVLDAEHNPAPLSHAHASLITWLSAQNPGAGGPTVVAGWLYVRTKVRDLADAEQPPATPVDPVATLRLLHERWLPAFADRAARIETALESATPTDLPDLVRASLQHFAGMIRLYLERLVPARRAVAASPPPGRPVASDHAPTSLADKARYLHVLPVAWDVASPSLAERLGSAHADALGQRSVFAPPTTLPADPDLARVQLTEWDDHLFALGMVPLRASYLRAAACLDLDPGSVFGLAIDELIEACAGQRSFGELAATRCERTRAQAELRPPPRLWHGWPLPSPSGGTSRGIAIGEDFEGRLAIRRSLDDLIARPPKANEIVCLPALTAQAAVALTALEIRAVCTEVGGALSHGALMARELGLSALIGCTGCTDLPDGTSARLDVRTGSLRPRGAV